MLGANAGCQRHLTVRQTLRPAVYRFLWVRQDRQRRPDRIARVQTPHVSGSFAGGFLVLDGFLSGGATFLKIPARGARHTRLWALVSRRDVLTCSRMCRRARFGMLDRRKAREVGGRAGPAEPRIVLRRIPMASPPRAVLITGCTSAHRGGSRAPTTAYAAHPAREF